ncbi:hypothetical protein [Marinobacter halophilus]|uniref:hypothetical protein n=1 Tax=Marinobacter halophilus TaxID=1323740 RepID=UPI0013FD4928|nr:hypothetical protein [Marinobacter halophilus]GGC66216.1 hypothetical protein GCM10011362_13300 [Marinobacter halophilus]
MLLRLGAVLGLSYLTIMLLMWLFQERLSVLILDYRGYGKSEGRPSEAGRV